MSVRRISGKEHNAFGELGLFDIKVEGESDGVIVGDAEGILVFKLVVAFQCTALKETFEVDRHGS